MTPTMTIETITPARAAELLSLNSNNRRIRKNIVATYARDMQAGDWKLTGAPLVLNGSELLDGQHRLLACVEAGVPFTTAVLYDADTEAHIAIDKGAKRTVADELRWRGETGDVARLSAVLSLLWRYEQAVLPDKNRTPSVAEVVELLDRNPGIHESLKIGRRIEGATKVAGGPFAVALHVIAREHGGEIASAFAGKVQTGIGLAEGDPVLALRNYAARIATMRTTRPRSEEWLAMIFKTFNNWLVGRPLRTVYWRRVGPAAEPFPTLIGRASVDLGQTP